MVRVKICGITNIEDALVAVQFGADALGFVFSESPRQVDIHTARTIAKLLPPFVSRVGVFVDEEPKVIQAVANLCFLDAVQLHGNESPEDAASLAGVKVIKALRVGDKEDLAAMPDYDVDAFLLDARVEGQMGGTGKTFDWSLTQDAKEHGLIVLSGGLGPDNVAEAVRQVHPYAVDASSRLEKEPGQKDHKLVKRFLEEAKSATT